MQKPPLFEIEKNIKPSDNLSTDVIENVGSALFAEAVKVNDVLTMTDILEEQISSNYIVNINKNIKETFLSSYIHNSRNNVNRVHEKIVDFLVEEYYSGDVVFSDTLKTGFKNSEINKVLIEKLHDRTIETAPGFLFAETDDEIISLSDNNNNLNYFTLLMANVDKIDDLSKI